MGFSKKTGRKGYDANASADRAATQADQGAPEERQPRVRPQMGINVWITLPSLDEDNGDPHRFVPVHYNPFHLCGRGDSVEVVNDDTGEVTLKDDKRFANCIRCKTAWDTWEDTGRAEGMAKDDMKANMSSVQTLVQAINVTPFFTVKAGNPSVNAKLAKKWLDEFVRIACEATTGDWQEVDIPADMPEDLSEAALAGISMVLLNKTTGQAFSQALRDEFFRDGADPLDDPSSKLLCIKVSESDKTFTGARGKQLRGRNYAVSFFNIRSKDWAITDAHFEQIIPAATNIHVREGDEEFENLQAKARAFVRMNDDEINQLLEESGHTYSSKQAALEAASEGTSDFEDDDDDDVAEADFDSAEVASKGRSLRERFKSRAS